VWLYTYERGEDSTSEFPPDSAYFVFIFSQEALYNKIIFLKMPLGVLAKNSSDLTEL